MLGLESELNSLKIKQLQYFFRLYQNQLDHDLV